MAKKKSSGKKTGPKNEKLVSENIREQAKQRAQKIQADKAKAKAKTKATPKANAKPKEKKERFAFFKGVKQEMSKVVWPGRKELATYTLVVIITCAIFAVGFWAIDTGVLAALRGLLGISM